MRTAARTQSGFALTCACRVHFAFTMYIRWAGGILDVPDVRRKRRKIDVGSILGIPNIIYEPCLLKKPGIRSLF